MRNKIRQIAAALLALCLCLGTCAGAGGSARSSDPYGDLKLRVGLAYDGNSTGSLVAANLENASGHGSGYRFGYYDDELDFVELGYTEETTISMVKTQNLYLVGKSYYDTDPGGNRQVLGCYHLQLPGAFSSFEEALDTARQVRDGFVAWIDGEYFVRCGAYTTREEAQAEADSLGYTVEWTSAYSVNVVVTGTTRILFQFDGGSALPLGVMPMEDGSGETITWFKGFKYYGGFRYERLSGGNITVVNIVPLNTYLKGVVPYESVKSWPLETLKAQAVCARNYALATGVNKHSRYHFDVCNTTDCQVYYGAGSGSISPSELTDRAVDETRGVYVWYDGELAETYFYSSNGGGSEDVSNVWGSSGYPYLQGVVDPYEADVADQANYYFWSYTYTADELTAILRTRGYGVGTEVVDFEVSEYSDTGNVLEMRATYANGKTNTFSTASSSWLRNALGCRSIHFTITGGGEETGGELTVNGSGTLSDLSGAYVISGDGAVTALETDTPYAITAGGTVAEAGGAQSSSVPEGTFVVTGTGWGHSVGFSQWGACAMGNRGYTYDEILKFYFTGVEVGGKS